ncbi:protein NRT1/ PTR FAMILY 5.6-like [Rhododendron vialii]|uniref:protein NRT1/ PTR FAMILY 5.6-like n=1 Tax=Rhododendron vialii TaxID=182163 RepID=UPI0026604781|nr:protein NRT1/ PTR FAMILY 5.6-like [Rhododendron vialii]
MSFSNWWTFGLCSGLLLALTVVSFVQHHVSWVVADITLTIVMASSLLVFCIGMPFYRYRTPTGSPLTPMVQVVVAAFSKRNLACPSNPSQLYEVSKSQKTEGRLLLHTDKLKFLDKAAIIDDRQDSTEKQQNPWRLTTVTHVEERGEAPLAHRQAQRIMSNRLFH